MTEPKAQTRGAREIMTPPFDFENVLCGVCSYPLDNEGLCVIDADHRGVLPSGDEARDLEASREQQRLTEPQGVDKIDFSCRVCGIQCAIAPDPPERAVCPEHCEDHNYVYNREDRGTFCEYCWQEAPHDYYLVD